MGWRLNSRVCAALAQVQWNNELAIPTKVIAQRRANRRCAALSRSAQRPKGARLSAMLCMDEHLVFFATIISSGHNDFVPHFHQPVAFLFCCLVFWFVAVVGVVFWFPVFL